MGIFTDKARSIAYPVLLTGILLGSLATMVWAIAEVMLCPVVGSRSSCTFVPLDVIPMVVALGYWGMGLANSVTRQKFPAILFFITGAMAIANGLVSGTGDALGLLLFYVSLAILSPLTLHFHTILLKRPLRLLEKLCVGFLYILAAAEVLPFLLGGTAFVQTHAAYPVLRLAIRFTFPVAILMTIIVLAYDYQHYSTLASRRQMRLYALGIIFAFTPLMISTLLPQTLGFSYIVPGINFSWLLLIPLIYTYSTHRNRLGATEKPFRIFLTYYLLFFTLLSVYLITTSVLNWTRLLNALEVTGLSVIILLCLLLPLLKWLSRLINWAFYGSETDYARAIEFLNQQLVKVLDRKRLITILLDELTFAVKPAAAVLFLMDPMSSDLKRIGIRGWDENRVKVDQLSCDSPLLTWLAAYGKPIETARLIKMVDLEPMPAENSLLHQLDVDLWLPILSEGALQGLMLWRCRAGDDLFTEEDKRLLETVMHGTGVAMRNVGLAENLHAGREELARAHRRLITAQEQERKRMAYELHDEIIQQLLGISYQLASMKKKLSAHGAELQKTENNLREAVFSDIQMTQVDLLKVVDQLRNVIRELRPAGLDELGLSAAIMGYVEQVRKTNGPEGPKIFFEVQEYLPDVISEPVSICAFRVAQEGLRNAIKHAQASSISVYLSMGMKEQLVLTVQDDGCGFELPDRLTELTRENHFGLVGITEQVLNLGGEVNIHSHPGKGTRIVAEIPFT